MFKKGFSMVWLVVILVVIVGGVLVWQLWPEKEVSLQTNQQNEQLTDWQTYTNEKYGFEFKYPKEHFELFDGTSEKNEFNYVYVREIGTYNDPLSVQISKSEYNNLEDFFNQFNDKKWRTNEKDKFEKINLLGTSAMKITSYSIPHAPNYISFYFLKGEYRIVLDLMYSNNAFTGNEVGEQILSTFRFLK